MNINGCFAKTVFLSITDTMHKLQIFLYLYFLLKCIKYVIHIPIMLFVILLFFIFFVVFFFRAFYFIVELLFSIKITQIILTLKKIEMATIKNYY